MAASTAAKLGAGSPIHSPRKRRAAIEAAFPAPAPAAADAPPPPPQTTPHRRLLAAAAVAALAASWVTLMRVEENVQTRADIPERAQNLLKRFKWIDANVDAYLDAKAKPSATIAAPPKHPVLFVPGIISCGLEFWRPGECFGSDYFRARVWGGLSMARAVVTNVSCWLDHMSLDPETGLDSAGHEVRAAEGFAGADYFVPGYWLWAKVLENFAAVGYDRSSMHVACYDWRLSYRRLEERDAYFTRLKAEVELLVNANGEKAVLVGHSMGASVSFFFLRWAEARAPGWAEAHLHAFVSLGGSLLGAVGPLGTVLSGEMKATAQTGKIMELLDAYAPHLTRKQQRAIYRSLGGLGSLLPKGGDAVWGPDLIRHSRNGTAATALGMGALEGPLRRVLGPHTGGYDLGARWPAPPGGGPLEAATENPLLAPLPRLPTFCVYGVNISTERAYYYASDAPADVAGAELGFIDHERPDGGVVSSDGDGTVPLVSLGFPCVGLWRGALGERYNPGGAPTYVREHADERWLLDPRGGHRTAKHVEILGNSEVIGSLLKIATGDDADIRSDRIVSDIEAEAAAVGARLLEQLGAPPEERSGRR